MKTIILGSTGYLGQYFKDLYPEALTPRVDIANTTAVAALLDEEKPDIVINCAGKTGRPNVDWCEENKEETLRVNVIGALIVMDECLKRGVYLVHIGSGCIYEGDNGGVGFSENDEPNFTGSFYSRTKLWSDQILQEFPVLNLRLRMPFDGTDNPRNLISKLKKYDRVLDVKNALTYLPDLMKAAKELIERRVTGTFNVVNPGTMSPYDIMVLYNEIVDPEHAFTKLTLEDLGDVASTGRSNCDLSVEKLRGEGIELPSAEDRVKEALGKMKG